MGRVRRQTPQQFFRRCRGLNAPTRAGERDCQPETRLVEIRIDAERALQWVYRFGRMTAVGEHESQVCSGDWVAWLDVFGVTECCDRCFNLPVRNLTAGES